MSNEPYSYTNAFSVKYRLERERQPFTRETVLQLPSDRCGLYSLWLPTGTEDAPERLYVGQSTTCVRRRLLQHLSNEDNPDLRRQLRMFRDLVEFSVVFTAGETETLELETTLIQEWQPETNRYKLKSRDD
jgi:excinuclease UvrABC nuclease subunit